MLAILRNLLSDPVHVYLLSGDVLATIAVGLGIIWEHGPPEVQRVANRLVIGGVIVETVCSIWLFAYDENISSGQQSVITSQNNQIIALEKQIAPRQLSFPQQFAIGATLVHFAGQRVRIESYALDAESAALGTQIAGALSRGRLLVDASGLLSMSIMGSLAVGVRVTGPNRALVDAIKFDLAMSGIGASSDPLPSGSGMMLGIMPGASADKPAATVFVAVKPLPQ